MDEVNIYLSLRFLLIKRRQDFRKILKCNMIIIVIKRSCLMICIRLSDTSHGKKYRKIWALGHLYRNKFSVNLSQKWWMDQRVSFSFFYVSFILCNDVKWSFSLRRPSKDKKRTDSIFHFLLLQIMQQSTAQKMVFYNDFLDMCVRLMQNMEAENAVGTTHTTIQ